MRTHGGLTEDSRTDSLTAPIGKGREGKRKGTLPRFSALLVVETPKTKCSLYGRLDLAMNENEINRIAAAANALRPDWPLASLKTLLARPEIANRPRRDVAVALTWVACESATKTPARVLEAGPWWQATNAEGTSGNQNPTKQEACATCGRRAADHASPWVGDHEFTPLDQATRGKTTAAALARAELARAREHLCGHGINRELVRCGDCELPRPTPTTEPTEEPHHVA